MLLSRLSREAVGFFLLALFLLLFFFADPSKVAAIQSNIPSTWLNVHTIFLSLFLEAIPFVLLGVFASSCIQVFITEEKLRRILPKQSLFALPPAALVGLLFPICECAIIPVVRRLIQKGLPLHVGMVILVSAPILNPIVFASTYYAFRNAPFMAYARLGLAFVAAILIGFAIYYLYKRDSVLREEVTVEHVHMSGGKWGKVLQHAVDEFFSTGKFLLFGAFIASLFQVFLDRSLLTQIADNAALSPFVMMLFGYVLSLCSEADAFIAASFQHTFSSSSLLAFLIFGPMLDVKNTLMLLAYFKKKFVLTFILLVTTVVYFVVQLAPV